MRLKKVVQSFDHY